VNQDGQIEAVPNVKGGYRNYMQVEIRYKYNTFPVVFRRLISSCKKSKSKV
jgi:hypothetical protein